MANVYHNNLCCLIEPQIVCTACEFRACRECDLNQGFWTLRSHNQFCDADDTEWGNNSMTLRLYRRLLK